jgi:hypothetical protein
VESRELHIDEERAMIPNALLITVSILLALGFWLMDQLKFFAPYRSVLFQAYGESILLYVAVLSVNVFAGTFALIRKFFLKDTGRKLLHLDRQIHAGDTTMPAPWRDEEAD